ncbi:hypothetical protein [Pararobbsia silviterrae]|uniref:hypothetical protein n=1 Tax=Pararobbsia silviterrae TaxID=1792498 RepID=UPI0011C38F82|nr:hypothetical protein [Pararobbsia silviterrae]
MSTELPLHPTAQIKKWMHNEAKYIRSKALRQAFLNKILRFVDSVKSLIFARQKPDETGKNACLTGYSILNTDVAPNRPLGKSRLTARFRVLYLHINVYPLLSGIQFQNMSRIYDSAPGGRCGSDARAG